jgi:hypothetical protein
MVENINLDRAWIKGLILDSIVPLIVEDIQVNFYGNEITFAYQPGRLRRANGHSRVFHNANRI